MRSYYLNEYNLMTAATWKLKSSVWSPIETSYQFFNQLPTDTLKKSYAYRSNSFSRIMFYKPRARFTKKTYDNFYLKFLVK